MLPRSRFASQQSKKFVEKKKINIALIASLIVVSVGTWIFWTSRFTQLNAFTISEINIEGADSEVVPSIQSAAMGSLQGDYLGLFSKSNVLIFPAQEVSKSIRAASPRVQSVALKSEGRKGLSIKVTQKTPSAIVCPFFPNFDKGENDSGEICYYADADGLLFQQAPEFSGSVFKTYFIPDLLENASSSDPEGLSAVPSQKFQELQDLYGYVQSENVNLVSMLIQEDGEYELYVKNPGSDSPQSPSSDLAIVYLNERRPLSDQLVNFISFWRKMSDEARINHKALSFEYIDVRYGSNVFYRLIK